MGVVEAVRLPNGAQPVINLVVCWPVGLVVGRTVCHCAHGRPTKAEAAIIADACCWRRVFFAFWATRF